MDSSVIALSLSLFNWTKYRSTKWAIKLHALMDCETGLPNYVVITDGKKHDMKDVIESSFPTGSVLVVYRVNVDSSWLNHLDSCGIFFVTQLKSNTNIAVTQSFLTNNRHEHILNDEDITLLPF